MGAGRASETQSSLHLERWSARRTDLGSIGMTRQFSARGYARNEKGATRETIAPMKQICLLKAESGLQFDGAAAQRILCGPEVCVLHVVLNVGEVQLIKQVEEIGPELHLAIFSQDR